MVAYRSLWAIRELEIGVIEMEEDEDEARERRLRVEDCMMIGSSNSLEG